MKTEYAVEYTNNDHWKRTSMMNFNDDYEDAKAMAKFFIDTDCTNVKILAREVTDWRQIHQSGLPEGTTKGEIND